MPLGLRMALRHLTVIPVGADARETDAAPARALPWFPLAGVVVAAVPSAVLLLPLPPLPRAALALCAWTAITGALHEDAWMDSADAALAVVPRERRLEILKDPHVGAHAVTALGLALVVRFAALGQVGWFVPLVAAVCGRWTMTLTLSHFTAARVHGLGAAYARDARAGASTLVSIALLAALLFIAGPLVLVGVAAALLTGLLVGAWLARRFGGLTGDGHGAAGYAAETAALIACAAA
jgi:adenosylcobinamide-GDP ribazoletransferase